MPIRSRMLFVVVLAFLVAGLTIWLLNARRADTGGVGEGHVDQPAQEPAEQATEEMAAIIPARLATELFDDPPEGCGVLAAYFGNPGGIEILYTVSDGAEASLYAVQEGEHRAVWTTASDRTVEIAGFKGWEVFLVFTDEPFESPADAWTTGQSFYGLDLQAPGVGLYPSHLDAETIETIRATIAPAQ